MYIELDKKLLVEIIKRTEDKSVQQIVDEALRSYLRRIKLSELARLRGKITWEGNLDEMREC